MKRENTIFKLDSVVDEILEIAYSMQKSRILITSCELGIFDVLNDTSKTASDISKELDTFEHSTERLLNALVNLEFLTKAGNRYSNTKRTNAFLVKESPNYIGSIKQFNYIWDAWSDLTEAVRDGRPVNFDYKSKYRPEKLKDFISAVHWRASIQAPYFVKHVDLTDVKTVLDLGCGSGAYGMELLKIKPEIEVTLFDIPEILEYTKKYAEIRNESQQIKILAGEYLTDNIGKGYDLVIASNIYHHHSFWENIELTRKIYDALNHNGKILIQEVLFDDNKTSPKNAVLLSLEMLVSSQSGNAFTESELWIILKEAWFSDFMNIQTEYGSNLIFGTK